MASRAQTAFFLLFLFGLTTGNDENMISYKGYSLYTVVPETKDKVEILREMSETSPDLDFWIPPNRINFPVNVMVAPGKKSLFETELKSKNLKYTVRTHNVQKLIQRELPLSKEHRKFGWKNYHTLSEIYEWLDSLAEQYPHIITPIVGGRTYENRTIRGVKLSHNNTDNVGVFIEAGIHAREWISPATVTFMLNKLLTSKDPDVKFIAENYDWYIFPTVNPDGYLYSQSVDRFWRKSRSKGKICDGVDLNRNFDNYWNQGGASSNECSDAYAGTGPFSEIETRTLSEYITSISDNIKFYFCFHAYSQLLMTPYGHDYEQLSQYDLLKTIGDAAAESLSQRYGTQYIVGSIREVIYSVTGASLDWAASTLKIPFTYVWELRDQGEYGFLLPSKFIKPTGLETLDSVVTILKEARPYLDLDIEDSDRVLHVNTNTKKHK